MKLDTSSYYPQSTLREDPETEAEVLTPSVDSTDTIPTSTPQPTTGENPSMDSKDSGESRLDTILNVVSQILSWVLVPMFIPIYGLLAVFNLSILSFIPMGSKVVITLIVGIITIAIPLIMAFGLKRAGIITDLGMNIRKERPIPYAISALALGGAALFLVTKMAPPWLWLYFAGGAVSAVICLIVNFWWKISAHGVGVAGLVALMLRIIASGMPSPEIYPWFIVSVILAGAVGSARVWLGKHTLMQVLAGYAVGFTCVYLISGL